MAKRKGSRAKGPKKHKFRNKLLLNQWAIAQFGVDPLAYYRENNTGKPAKRPFHVLSEKVRHLSLSGLDKDNLHYFYHAFVESEFFYDYIHTIKTAQLLSYEENIVKHTLAINEKRDRPIVWKYFQWLSLLFVELYLDRYFSDREALLNSLNEYVAKFNRTFRDHADVDPFTDEDLNKVSTQNATGSGKTLLMHVNLLQYKHYAVKHGKERELSRTILITPNENLSKQHVNEFAESGIHALNFAKEGANTLFSGAAGLQRVDVLEITKLADKAGPQTIETRALGDQNLLLVDEGHRGLSGGKSKSGGDAWIRNRSMLCEQGFSFEYSATFEQAVSKTIHEDDYARSVLFDYSYRWFYEDGFGKDYQILNLPKSFDEVKANYLTACLLKFFQQQHIYKHKKGQLHAFNIESPLWVFVGRTVSGVKTKDEKLTATDVAKIIVFIAGFLSNKAKACQRIQEILTGAGTDTGLVDGSGYDIFDGAFNWLLEKYTGEDVYDALYRDILDLLFNSQSGGHLALERTKGASGEIVLRVGTSETPFGLINVGDAKGLGEHIEEYAQQEGLEISVSESDFSDTLFDGVKDSGSPINLLLGSKKFVEGWDCWRVSTLGLMHVGRSEGAQIIQLFGRGVRLKGYNWSLKRSGHVNVRRKPTYIEELETLNVFGIEADFMDKFRQYLLDEGLPGNERRRVFNIPLNVTHDFGKKLKIIRPKRKADDGREYSFKKDGPVPTLGEPIQAILERPVISDWFPRIQRIDSVRRHNISDKESEKLDAKHLAFIDYDALYFALEAFKRERTWYNLNISRKGIQQMLANPNWYTLFLPAKRLEMNQYEDVILLQEVATELLKRYCEKYYKYAAREFIEPRLEVRELTSADENIPQDEFYQLVVDGEETQLIQNIEKLKAELAENKDQLTRAREMEVQRFGMHLFQPLFHVKANGRIKILPVSLNQSEFQFVSDLKNWATENETTLENEGVELFLLRNLSRGKGVGFFEAGNFHPDFILWMLVGEKQYVTFIEPHGLIHEGPGSEKVQFYKQIKEIERRLDDPDVVLNSFILSWTKYPQLKWDKSQAELEEQHVLFMTDDQDRYIGKLINAIKSDALAV